jgi:hypothetical protein
MSLGNNQAYGKLKKSKVSAALTKGVTAIPCAIFDIAWAAGRSLSSVK